MALLGCTRARPTTTVPTAELERLALDPDAVVTKDGGRSIDVGGRRYVAETERAGVGV